MLRTAELVAFVSTRDVAAARRFYEDALSLPQLEQDELGTWLSPSGARVLWFHDPDANVLSLTQS
jgi:catechol 2,3-dioxygenase-like lactoylglutathione lyase family enzyme